MDMVHYRPERIYLESAVSDSPITRSVLAKLPETAVIPVDSAEKLLEDAREKGLRGARAKKSLVLSHFRGRFFKPCPGQQSRASQPNVCCDYFVINFASNCHMECTYCYLNSYLNFPFIVVYANVDDLLGELNQTICANPRKHFRVGTGELADSLGLDPLTEYSGHLIEFFARQENAVLELKTKSSFVEHLLDLDHRGKTVLAWSLNPPEIQRREEHKTASIEERLDAAEKCLRAGFPLAFHFDPLVHYEGWQEGYRGLVDELFSRFPSRRIAWISLGGLRMPPEQAEIMKRRFPGSRLAFGELVPAEDGKLRYFKPIRVELYGKMLSWIRERDPAVKVYACMERPEIWSRVFGEVPESGSSLGESLVAIDH